MSVVAIILALLIEQWRPLGEHKGVSSTLAAWAGSLERSFNGGAREHGLTAWLVAVLPPVAISILLHALLSAANWLLALAFDIAVLYLTLGFRQFSHYFTDIQLALKSGDIDRARALLDQWRGASGVVRTREEVVRLSIEEALLAAHRHVFGVLLWYLIFPGRAARSSTGWPPTSPHAGATSAGSPASPSRRSTCSSGQPCGSPRRRSHSSATSRIRCTAGARRRAPGPIPTPALLAAGAGAMGVRLGMPVQEMDGLQPRPELGVGEEADGPFLDTTVGMLWRALVLWVAVLAGAAIVAHSSRFWS